LRRARRYDYNRARRRAETAMKSLIAIVFALGLAAAPAAAQDLTFDGHSNVTLKLSMPDTWFSDPNPDSTIVLKSPDHSSAITLSIVASTQEPDDLAAALMKGVNATPPQKDAAAAISGHDGQRYISSVVNSHGVHANIRLTVVRANPQYVIVCMAVFQDNLPADEQESLNGIVDSIAIQPPV
jgi:hypothetical protein